MKILTIKTICIMLLMYFNSCKDVNVDECSTIYPVRYNLYIDFIEKDASLKKGEVEISPALEKIDNNQSIAWHKLTSATYNNKLLFGPHEVGYTECNIKKDFNNPITYEQYYLYRFKSTDVDTLKLVVTDTIHNIVKSPARFDVYYNDKFIRTYLSDQLSNDPISNPLSISR